jgi:Ca-activated chloride channel family protein
VDPAQPQTVLEVPPAEVITGIQALWRRVKKPVDLVVVLDVSGSMHGEKIAAARNSLIQFIDLLDDRDRLAVILFSQDVIALTPLSPLGEKRDDVRRRVSGIVEQGDTALYRAVSVAYDDLLTNADPRHIRAMVVLSDGANTVRDMALDDLLAEIGTSAEAGTAPKVFTIAFGSDADRAVLERIAEATGGRQYDSDPDTIEEVYALIATFF